MLENKKVLLTILTLIASMVIFAFASVPLYSLFCKVTNFGGLPNIVNATASRIGTRVIKVSFDANVDKGIPWSFRPEQKDIKIRPGENALIFYSATNNSDKPVIGTAIYNITPLKAAKYFNKIQCFCFEEQLLKPGQQMMMPVSFFIDPDIENDKNLLEVKDITLSYTFYKSN
jgi:cytochrome c oxidase assembly protein subunit 11